MKSQFPFTDLQCSPTRLHQDYIVGLQTGHLLQCASVETEIVVAGNAAPLTGWPRTSLNVALPFRTRVSGHPKRVSPSRSPPGLPTLDGSSMRTPYPGSAGLARRTGLRALLWVSSKLHTQTVVGELPRSERPVSRRFIAVRRKPNKSEKRETP